MSAADHSAATLAASTIRGRCHSLVLFSVPKTQMVHLVKAMGGGEQFIRMWFWEKASTLSTTLASDASSVQLAIKPKVPGGKM